MFFDLDLQGAGLPPQTLCLTYDDGPGRTEGSGPGPKTAEIGHFLADRGIAATFFVIGDHVRANPGIVARLRAGGHLVANHTDTHPTLVSFVRDGGDVVGELARTDEAIGSPSAHGELTFFRAPYGYWREEPDPDDPTADGTTSTTARILNDGGRFPHVVGPVGWDIDVQDWSFWRSGASAEDCGHQFLDQIERVRRGIVLFHDSSESAAIRTANLTFELTRWLIPILEDRGYRFVRLDEVPGVASASRVARQVTFGAGPGRWLTCPPETTQIQLTPSRPRLGGRECFGIVPLGMTDAGELVGLRAWNGCYVERSGPDLTTATATSLDDPAHWILQPADRDRITLRSPAGAAIVATDDPGAIRLEPEPGDPLTFAIAILSGAIPRTPGA